MTSHHPAAPLFIRCSDSALTAATNTSTRSFYAESSTPAFCCPWLQFISQLQSWTRNYPCTHPLPPQSLVYTGMRTCALLTRVCSAGGFAEPPWSCVLASCRGLRQWRPTTPALSVFSYRHHSHLDPIHYLVCVYLFILKFHLLFQICKDGN